MTTGADDGDGLLEALYEHQRMIEYTCSDAVMHLLWALYGRVRETHSGSVFILREFQKALSRIPSLTDESTIDLLSGWRDIDLLSEVLIKYRYLIARFSNLPPPTIADVVRSCAIASARSIYRRPELFYEDKLSPPQVRRNLATLQEIVRSQARHAMQDILNMHLSEDLGVTSSEEEEFDPSEQKEDSESPESKHDGRDSDGDSKGVDEQDDEVSTSRLSPSRTQTATKSEADRDGENGDVEKYSTEQSQSDRDDESILALVNDYMRERSDERGDGDDDGGGSEAERGDDDEGPNGSEAELRDQGICEEDPECQARAVSRSAAASEAGSDSKSDSESEKSESDKSESEKSESDKSESDVSRSDITEAAQESPQRTSQSPFVKTVTIRYPASSTTGKAPSLALSGGHTVARVTKIQGTTGHTPSEAASSIDTSSVVACRIAKLKKKVKQMRRAPDAFF